MTGGDPEDSGVQLVPARLDGQPVAKACGAVMSPITLLAKLSALGPVEKGEVTELATPALRAPGSRPRASL